MGSSQVEWNISIEDYLQFQHQQECRSANRNAAEPREALTRSWRPDSVFLLGGFHDVSPGEEQSGALCLLLDAIGLGPTVATPAVLG
jgi:hypothetical protein